MSEVRQVFKVPGSNLFGDSQVAVAGEGLRRRVETVFLPTVDADRAKVFSVCTRTSRHLGNCQH